MILTREQILQSDDLQPSEVEVKEWGGSVFVRAMDAEERSDIEKRFKGRDPTMDLADFRTTLVALTTANEKGELLFTLDDIALLKKKHSNAIETIFETASAKNGFTKKDVEELEKNSESDPNEDSLSI